MICALCRREVETKEYEGNNLCFDCLNNFLLLRESLEGKRAKELMVLASYFPKVN